MISTAAFDVTIPGIEIGKEYKVEFYADLNKNGLYDAPPTDHAWELKFTNSSGDFDLPFTHIIDFKDINWKYLYTLNLSGMTPHLSQLFELRVVRIDNGKELGRTSLSAVPVADFLVSIPQIEIGHDYRVDFYADHNGSKQYDAPPTDHAWRLTFNSTTGNFVQNFIHNINFTDIQWPNTTDVVDEIKELKRHNYQLVQNYPNPFNPTTKIRFSIPNSEFVTLKIFNILGKEIATIIKGNMSSGVHEFNFDAAELQSGIYAYKLEAGNFVDVKKMILVK